MTTFLNGPTRNPKVTQREPQRHPKAPQRGPKAGPRRNKRSPMASQKVPREKHGNPKHLKKKLCGQKLLINHSNGLYVIILPSDLAGL